MITESIAEGPRPRDGRLEAGLNREAMAHPSQNTSPRDWQRASRVELIETINAVVFRGRIAAVA